MQRHSPLRLWSLPRRGRLQPAPIRRQLATIAIDFPLYTGLMLAGERLITGQLNMSPKGPATEKLEAMIRAQKRGEPVDPAEVSEVAIEARNEARRSLATALGPQPWTPAKAWYLLAQHFILPSATAWSGGLTPGALLLGVRVVRSDGRPLTVRQSLVRSNVTPILRAVSLRLVPVGRLRATLLWSVLSVVWACFDPDRRSPGELLSGTRVVTETSLGRR